MGRERVKDNQWWYSKSVHRPIVEHVTYVVLSIAGRECPMMHSNVGTNGKITRSFKFVRPRDREYWRKLRGEDVEIDVVDAGNEPPELDSAGDDVDCHEPDVSEVLGEPFEMSPIVRCGETLFDAYIFIDWSASSRPRTGRDSIWIAEGTYNVDGVLVTRIVDNPATREAAEKLARELLVEHVKHDRRVLVGFDFPYGYPMGWHAALGQPADTWDELWDLLAHQIRVDNGKNDNNRWEVANAVNANNPVVGGPYWGRPARRAGLINLPITKPGCFADGSVSEFRSIEESLRIRGRRPMSVWQLLGNGSVGSQAMLGIPVLYRLRYDDQLKYHSRVWPFETEDWECPTEQRPFVLHAEIWPGAIEVIYRLHEVRDAAQVLSYVRWAATLDSAGQLAHRFTPSVPEPKEQIRTCEGWILA